MGLSLALLATDGTVQRYRLQATPLAPARLGAPFAGRFNRIAYSAAHVVADPRAAIDPWLDCALDWDATLAYRRHLWSLGLGVAEAMDTAQRGTGLDWPTSLELIRRSLDAARDLPGALLACGCGTDHLLPDAVRTVDDVIRGYEEQMAAIEALGGRLIIMASRALARVARTPADYERVYDRILSQARQPVLLHWLGAMFDPGLAGYWRGSNPPAAAGGAAGGGNGQAAASAASAAREIDAAMETVLGIIAAHPAKVDGIKISLLDRDRELALRRRLPGHGGSDGQGVRMYTGDDFNYPELIAGDGQGSSAVHGHSDALLGIFDAIAPAASAALSALGAGDSARFHAILAPTVPLSRHIFTAPTRFYKTGVVFMAWLNGHQSHFTLVGGQHSSRSLLQLCELFRLADAASLLRQPELALQRMKTLLALHGLAD